MGQVREKVAAVDVGRPSFMACHRPKRRRAGDVRSRLRAPATGTSVTRLGGERRAFWGTLPSRWITPRPAGLCQTSVNERSRDSSRGCLTTPKVWPR
jgi:hypothetical protein